MKSARKGHVANNLPFKASKSNSLSLINQNKNFSPILVPHIDIEEYSHPSLSSLLRQFPSFPFFFTSMAVCVTDTARAAACRNGSAAAHLKVISIVVIFFTSMFGMSLPVLLARYFQGKSLYDKAIIVIKCFAAGVILSTSLVHVLPDAYAALADCQVSSHHPWKDFPFAGLVTLIGALMALFVDIAASSHVEHTRLQGELTRAHAPTQYALVESGEAKGEMERERERLAEEEVVRLKQRLVSQVLEIGIIFHSVIIGVTMGMSQNVCTIRPLVAALAFHQIFEGMGLGGCVAQVSYLLQLSTHYSKFFFF